jgi:hypothetical protein
VPINWNAKWGKILAPLKNVMSTKKNQRLDRIQKPGKEGPILQQQQKGQVDPILSFILW